MLFSHKSAYKQQDIKDEDYESDSIWEIGRNWKTKGVYHGGPMISNFFRKAKKTTITSGSGSFSHVQGDQINYTTTIVQAEEKERTELDEYFEVKRGAICRLKNVHIDQYLRDNEDRCRCQSCEEDRVQRVQADRLICTAELVDRPGRVFTMVEYRGPDARKAFEKDFSMLMSLTSNGPQMYGYNLSTIPSILVYNELVPAAQVNAGIVGRVYLRSLSRQLHCGIEEMWLDPARGVFCRGLPGPTPWLSLWIFHNEELPLTAELVQEDVLLRFLAGLKSKHVDDVVVHEVAFSGASTRVPEGVLRPMVISTLTNAPIAVANNTWTSIHRTLSDRTLLADGMARFTLTGGGYLWLGWNWDARWAWMAQAWSVFGARGISMEEDLSVYHLNYPCTSLEGDLSDSEARRRSRQLIYLFVQPPPFDLDNGDTSSVHFWSFDEDGQSPLSRNLCQDFGLPTTFSISQSPYSVSWSNEAYDSLRQYQLLRGFDPSTADFARSLGYENIFQPLSDSDRFAQVGKGSSQPPLKDEASTLAAHISAPEDPMTTHPAQKSSEPTTSSTRRTSLSTPSVAETAVGHDAEPESLARLSIETEGPLTHWAKPGFLKKWCNLVSETVACVDGLDYSVVAC
ncbi:hypothetical protein PQX77_020715 [Marasmius sp. AFHP31]|nr:hypothetical protein PQX77_020715 [Marasmius sp. AFHP31]